MLDDRNTGIVPFLSSKKSWRSNPIGKKSYRKGSILKVTSMKIFSPKPIEKVLKIDQSADQSVNNHERYHF